MRCWNALDTGRPSRQRDGSLARPRTIWVVRHGDDLYVRSVNGRTSAWFRGTQARAATLKLVPR
jgi:hypothetical protein